MPEGIPYSSTNVIAGAGQDITFVGKRVFAYSGLIDYDNSGNQTMLDFDSGSDLIIAEFTFSYNARVMGGADLGWQISLNGVPVWTSVIESQSPAYMDVNLVPLVLPPYTKVLVEMVNPAGSSAAGELNCTMTGKVD
jgi:hypothetical protein